MNDLIEKLGDADEDNYIYLDKDGNAQLCIEINLKWNLLPTKRFVLTCSSDDSLSYLRTRICELMEKYPIFSGLNSLCSINLSNNKLIFPKHGNVGKVLKSGDIMSFDLDSKDIWLDIQVECIDIKLVIFFEARVAKSLKINTFGKYLIEIINQILKANRIELRYDSDDLYIRKMHIGEAKVTAKTLKSSVLGQGNLPQFLRDIERDSSISECFDYLDRCLLAELQKQTMSSSVRKISFSGISGDIEAKALESMSSELPMRGLRVEEKKVIDNEAKPRHRRGNEKPELNSTVCSCFIF